MRRPLPGTPAACVAGLSYLTSRHVCVLLLHLPPGYAMLCWVFVLLLHDICCRPEYSPHSAGAARKGRAAEGASAQAPVLFPSVCVVRGSYVCEGRVTVPSLGLIRPARLPGGGSPPSQGFSAAAVTVNPGTAGCVCSLRSTHRPPWGCLPKHAWI